MLDGNVKVFYLARDNQYATPIFDMGLLEKAVSEASHTGTSKKAEVHLRRHTREMETLRISVSFNEREALDEVLSRIMNLRQEILYSIMNPPRESAKR